MKAILFDADGVLFDATELHKETLNIALTEHGYAAIEDEEHRRTFNGLPTRVKLDILTEMGRVPANEHEKIEATKQKHTLAWIPKTIKPIPDLLVILSDLLDEGYQLAICSNARLKSVNEMAKCAKIEPYFTLILGNESVLRNKPYPDIYLVAAKQLGVPITQCVIVEDSPKGLVAAIQAGPGIVLKVSSPEDTITQLERLL
jgi:beta-phosphoglucomutase